MAADAIQNLSRSKIPSLPDDIDKVVGASNLLLIDILANISAFFYELYQKGSKLFENFSTDFTYETNRYSVKIKQSVTEKIIKLDLFHFSKEQDKKDMKKVVGKVNLLMIDGASYIAAFFKVLSHRLLHVEFLKAMKLTAVRFSYNSKMKIYCRLSDKEVKFEPISYPSDSKEDDNIDFDLHPSKNKKDFYKSKDKRNASEVIEEKEISEKNKHKEKSTSLFFLYKVAIATLFFGYFLMFLYFSSDSPERGFRRDNPKLVTLCINSCYLNNIDIRSLAFNKELNCYYVQTMKYC